MKGVLEVRPTGVAVPTAPRKPRLRAIPKSEGPVDKSVTVLMQRAIDEFHPDKAFTQACLARMKFKDRSLNGLEKIAVLGIVRLYNPDYQQLTLVNYIGYFEKLDSNEINLSAFHNKMKAGAVVDVTPFRRDQDTDLRRQIVWKKPDQKVHKRESDDDY